MYGQRDSRIVYVDLLKSKALTVLARCEYSQDIRSGPFVRFFTVISY